MESCLLTCPKLQRSEVPLITNKEEYDHFMVALTERVFLPQADRQFRPRLVCCSVWLTLSDSGEEGVWRDYFTNQTAPQVREDLQTLLSGNAIIQKIQKRNNKKHVHFMSC